MGNEPSSEVEATDPLQHVDIDHDDDDDDMSTPDIISETGHDSSSSSTSSYTTCSTAANAENPGATSELPYQFPEDEDEQDTTTECYRMPILFQKKSNPLTILNANSIDGDEDLISSPAYTTRESSSCFPSKKEKKTSLEASSSKSKSFFSSQASVLSFQNCTAGERKNSGSTSSSILGCVSTPLSNSNSWSNLLLDEDTYAFTEEELNMVDGDLPTEASDIQGPKDFWIVTTAALPWMTGTAVNPLLRAAYLSQRNRRLLAATAADNDDKDFSMTSGPTVTLVLPWLNVAEDRLALYGADWEDATPERQEAYIRNWLAQSAQLPLEASLESGGIRIQWYSSRYHKSLSSIFAMGDLCELIPEDTSNMICILEEPEHVNCYRAPGRESWRDKFPHVIGIVHTNYKAYAQNHYSGLFTGPIVGALMGLMVTAYCDRVVKLSPVLQSYAPFKEVVSNVHGIRQEFFTIPQPSKSPKQIYFIGKLLWAKGLDKLLDLEACFRKATGAYFPVDIYGSGPQEAAITKSFLGQDFFGSTFKSSTSSMSTSSSHMPEDKSDENNTNETANPAKRYWRLFRQPIPARFVGRKDHAEVGRSGRYQIFVNPSITEVLCTTTAEAVAMGFWVIVPKHASNEFFLTFGSCLQYSNRRDFCEILQYCLSHDPPAWGATVDRGSPEGCFGALSWEAATDRLVETASLSKRDAKRSQRLQPRDKSIQEWHYALGRGTRGDVLRKVLGGGPVADQSQYVATPSSSPTSCNSNSPTVATLS